MKPRPQLKSRQEGVMLLEALLGILIFSLGILAVVGMQAMAVKTVAESKYRMDAGFLANEIIGEMWVKQTALAADFVYPGGAAPEVQNWAAKVQAALPGATVSPPEIDIDVNNTVNVTIYWQHPEEANLTPRPPPHQYRVITSINSAE